MENIVQVFFSSNIFGLVLVLSCFFLDNLTICIGLVNVIMVNILSANWCFFVVCCWIFYFLEKERKNESIDIIIVFLLLLFYFFFFKTRYHFTRCKNFVKWKHNKDKKSSLLLCVICREEFFCCCKLSIISFCFLFFFCFVR